MRGKGEGRRADQTPHQSGVTCAVKSVGFFGVGVMVRISSRGVCGVFESCVG